MKEPSPRFPEKVYVSLIENSTGQLLPLHAFFSFEAMAKVHPSTSPFLTCVPESLLAASQAREQKLREALHYISCIHWTEMHVRHMDQPEDKLWGLIKVAREALSAKDASQEGKS